MNWPEQCAPFYQNFSHNATDHHWNIPEFSEIYELSLDLSRHMTYVKVETFAQISSKT